MALSRPLLVRPNAPRGDAHWTRKMKKDSELLLSFIKMNDLLPAFELFRQSQGEKDTVKTSSSGALSPKEDVVAKDDKSSNGGDGDDEPSDGDSSSDGQGEEPDMSFVVMVDNEVYKMKDDNEVLVCLKFMMMARLNIPWHDISLDYVDTEDTFTDMDDTFYVGDLLTECLGVGQKPSTIVGVDVMLKSQVVVNEQDVLFLVIVREQFGQRLHHHLQMAMYQSTGLIKKCVQYFMAEKKDINVDCFMVNFQDDDYETVDYIPEGLELLTVNVSIYGRGGALKKVLKPHLKESEAKTNFIQKSHKTLKSYLEDAETKTNLAPAEVLALVQPMMNRMEEFKRKASAGEDVLIDGLNSLSDEQLVMLERGVQIQEGGIH